ncbi:MAG: T7SS effector LXG polymorphic toxin, partial [Gallicola sp.]|nr:T7SS effector LXG polymorphic toxin [Gallicola sp.]
MGQRVAVNYDALCAEIANMNAALEKRSENAVACINAIRQFNHEPQLTGQAYSNAKDFYQNVYAPLLNQVVYISQSLIANNNQIISNFSANVPDTRGFEADTAVLEEEINRLKSENNEYSNCIWYYDDTEDEDLIYLRQRANHWYRHLIRINKELIAKLEKVIDGLRTFNGSCSGIYQESMSLIAAFSNAVAALGAGITWDAKNRRYVLPEKLKNLLLDIELEKIKTKDGNLDWNYIKGLFQQASLDEHEEGRIYVYQALIESFEHCKTDKEIEKFLNACYVEGYEERNPTGEWVQPETYYKSSLSPVFIDMLEYYNTQVVAPRFEQLKKLEYLYSSEGKAIREKLSYSGLLNILLKYGSETIFSDTAPIGECNRIKVEFESLDQISLQIKSKNEHDYNVSIVQFPFDRGIANEQVVDEIAGKYIRGTMVDPKTVIAEVFFGTTVGNIPIASGAYTALDSLGSLVDVYASNTAAENTVNAMELSDVMAAFGINGQPYTVNGKLEFQYLNLDTETFLLNFAA